MNNVEKQIIDEYDNWYNRYSLPVLGQKPYSDESLDELQKTRRDGDFGETAKKILQNEGVRRGLRQP